MKKFECTLWHANTHTLKYTLYVKTLYLISYLVICNILNYTLKKLVDFFIISLKIALFIKKEYELVI